MRIARRLFPAVALTAFVTGAAAEPWTLAASLRAPENPGLEGSYRLRYETLDAAFRAGASGSDEILVQRLLLHARYDHSSLYAGAELQDSRAELADTGTPLGTDDVNALELLRAYVGYRRAGVVQEGDELDLTLGRITIDAGSRRLVARNRFRNTINAFDGVHGLWSGSRGDQVQAFFAMPVERRPGDLASLLDNDVAFDRTDDATRFWGVQYTRPQAFGNWTGELYLFGLRESDRAGVATRDRDVYTPGFRLFVAPAPGAFDYEIETALQFGDSRLSTSTTDRLLDHFGRFHHVHAAYTADNGWETRLVLQYDYASGDRDPLDGDNGRFDTLFGARRFELGATGIYGALARSNISSPGIRLEAKPGAVSNAFVAWRAVYLASARDAAVAGLQDPSGASGRCLGHQLETRIRYEIVPDNVQLEFGAAWLIKDRYFETVPNAPEASDTTYFYAQVGLTF